MCRKTSSFIFVIIFLISTNLFSQKIFREGFILKNNNETFNGLVEYAFNQDVPATCAFKRFDIALKVTYSPEQIKAFGYRNGNRYETKSLFGKVSFYEVIISGKINLYRKGSKYFVEKDQQGLVELKEGKILYTYKNEKRDFNSLTEFLKFITENKTGNISGKFNLKNEIIPLITAYNKDSGNSYLVYNRVLDEKSLNETAMRSGIFKNRFGIVAGISNYDLEILPEKKIYYPTPGVALTWTTGLSYERLISRKTGLLFCRLELLFLKQTFYSYSENTFTVGTIDRNDAFFDFSGIKAPVMLQYSFTKTRVIPFVNGGVALQTFLRNSYSHTEEIESIDSHIITTNQDNDLKFKPFEVSFLCGAGIKARLINNYIISFQGRIEYGSGIFVSSPPSQLLYNNIFSSQTSFQTTFLIGITF